MLLKLKGHASDGARSAKTIKVLKRQFTKVKIFSRDFDWQEFSLGGNREGEIPEPIPNSEVKPFIADGTAHKSVEE